MADKSDDKIMCMHYWMFMMSTTEGDTKYSLHQCQICKKTKIKVEKIIQQNEEPKPEERPGLKLHKPDITAPKRKKLLTPAA